MDLNTLIYKTRSIRRFQQLKAIDDAQMRYFIDMARLAPSGGNIQPLKYFYSNNKKLNAGFSKHYHGPDT
jgi:nitroreductase